MEYTSFEKFFKENSLTDRQGRVKIYLFNFDFLKSLQIHDKFISSLIFFLRIIFKTQKHVKNKYKHSKILKVPLERSFITDFLGSCVIGEYQPGVSDIYFKILLKSRSFQDHKKPL